jgi:hypothetical protein
MTDPMSAAQVADAACDFVTQLERHLRQMAS